MNDPDFFRKIRLCHFVSFIVLQLHAKFWKDPMISFQENLRTDTQTHRQGSIYRTNLQSRWVQKDQTVECIPVKINLVIKDPVQPNQTVYISWTQLSQQKYIIYQGPSPNLQCKKR